MLTEKDLLKMIYEIEKYSSYISELNDYQLQKISEYLKFPIAELQNKALQIYYHNKNLDKNFSLRKEEFEPLKLKTFKRVNDIIEREVAIRQESIMQNLLKKNESPVKKYPRNKNQNKLSFKWNDKISKDYHIDILHRKLKSGGYIESISYKDFQKIFSGVPLSDITTQIRWKGLPTELLCLLKEMEDKEIIDLKKPKGEYRDWIKVKSCFVLSDGSPFTQELKGIFNNCDKLAASKYVKLKEIVDSLLII